MPPQQALVEMGAEPHPAAALHRACAVLPHQMEMKSLNSSLLTPRPGCLGTDVPPGNGVGRVMGCQHTSCAEQGFGGTVCLDSSAALLHLSAGQSGTQDYETSSHEPLPRTPTCTTCKCHCPCPLLPLLPVEMWFPRWIPKVPARRGKGNADGEREAEVGKARRWKSKMHREVEWAAVEDWESSCWAAEGFGILISAPALMAALTSSPSLPARWLPHFSLSAEFGAAPAQPEPAPLVSF